jgi:hypothetical protein
VERTAASPLSRLDIRLVGGTALASEHPLQLGHAP